MLHQNLSILTVCILWSCNLFSQYTFETRTEAYEELQSPTSLNNGTPWDEQSFFPIHFGFDFNMGGQIYDTLRASAGGINFDGNLFFARILTVYHTPFGGYMLRDRDSITSASPISYEISGGSGQKVLKVQWKNAGFVQWYPTSNTTDYVDFQIWLFEDDHLEIHFGNNSTTPGTYNQSAPNSASGPNIVFTHDTCSNTIALNGSPASPNFNYYNYCNATYNFLSATPDSGMVYIFNPIGLGQKDQIETEFGIYPIPASDILYLEHLESPQNTDIAFDIIVTDIMGREILSYPGVLFHNNVSKVPILTLENGTYFLNIYQDGKPIQGKRFVKAD